MDRQLPNKQSVASHRLTRQNKGKRIGLAIKDFQPQVPHDITTARSNILGGLHSFNFAHAGGSYNQQLGSFNGGEQLEAHLQFTV